LNCNERKEEDPVRTSFRLQLLLPGGLGCLGYRCLNHMIIFAVIVVDNLGSAAPQRPPLIVERRLVLRWGLLDLPRPTRLALDLGRGIFDDNNIPVLAYLPFLLLLLFFLLFLLLSIDLKNNSQNNYFLFSRNDA